MAPRDSEALRRVATISREFGDLLTGTIFRPHVPYSLYGGVFVSEFTDAEAEVPRNSVEEILRMQKMGDIKIEL